MKTSLSHYIESSEKFMRDNPDYSTFLGKYFTLAKPILGFNRVPFERLTVVDYDIASDNPSERMNMLSKLLLLGIFPFYGIRRGAQFNSSCKVFNELKYGSIGEFSDQILLSYFGKIYCDNSIMLIRDETKIKHVKNINHQRNDDYINSEDLADLKVALKNHVDIDEPSLRDFSSNWVPISQKKDTLAMINFKKLFTIPKWSL